MRSLRDSMIPLEEVRGHKLHVVRAKQSQRPLWLCDCSCGLWQGEASSLDWARARWHEHLIAWLFGDDRIEAGA